jgi:hypothetical protein
MATTTSPTCSCGVPACGPESHVIARTKTADDIIVKLWSDGGVTLGLNTIAINGARKPAALDVYLAAGWLAFGDVELYDAAEVADLARAARWSVARGRGLGGMRQRFAAVV